MVVIPRSAWTLVVLGTVCIIAAIVTQVVTLYVWISYVILALEKMLSKLDQQIQKTLFSRNKHVFQLFIVRLIDQVSDLLIDDRFLIRLIVDLFSWLVDFRLIVRLIDRLIDRLCDRLCEGWMNQLIDWLKSRLFFPHQRLWLIRGRSAIIAGMERKGRSSDHCIWALPKVLLVHRSWRNWIQIVVPWRNTTTRLQIGLWGACADFDHCYAFHTEGQHLPCQYISHIF